MRVRAFALHCDVTDEASVEAVAAQVSISEI